MAEQILIQAESKAEKYEQLLPQIEALIATESDYVANLANVVAALRQVFGFFWVGFYLVKGKDLVLAPFQGTIACTRIGWGRGVCGTAWAKKQSIIVPDVEQFEGHIACSSASKSEIVVPIFKNDEVVGVLDVDSEQIKDFDETDRIFLEKIVAIISPKMP